MPTRDATLPCMSAPDLTLLLPAGDAFGAQRLPEPIARALGRADLETVGEAGEADQLRRHVDVVPRGWPVAALTRQRDAGDAAGATWLRADPAWIRPDINGARLLGVGDALGLDAADAEALLRPLKPLFGDAGVPIDAPVPGRWYVRLPAGATPPVFAGPDEALGADVFEVLAEGAEARRWRSLLSEAQIVLHNHPVNAQRADRGAPPVNSLWFWGGSRLPDRVTARAARLLSADEALRAIAAAGGAMTEEVDRLAWPLGADTLVDLRTVRDLRMLAETWWIPALDALRARTLSALVLDLADGRRFTIRQRQRWRFWRRARGTLGA
ncbi:phosphoglycerate mutase [Luteimonas abyssi]|uniref:phosphoglycerate mutase n=1 Tax=Luteimonas abyssi TaxID=1247514 RepID=UPI000AFF1630|nr:phosphoglycerate mutase [Luteimonas abyssi]